MTNVYFQKVVTEQEKGLELARKKCIELYGKRVENGGLSTTDSKYASLCPPLWDNILCWPPTTPGTLASQNCPSHVAGFLPSFNATRQCTSTGDWFKQENTLWANYTACFKSTRTTIYVPVNKTDIPKYLQDYVRAMEIISNSGYIVSLVTLIIAFGIMLSIKKLHCARNILHMHLFASFILRAFIDLTKKSIFVEGLGLSSDFYYQNGSTYFNIELETNNWTCKLLVSIWQYCVTANYSWILMEGLYLHNLIFRALFADYSTKIKWYIIMGWGFPLIVIGSWVCARLLFEDNLCWTTNENDTVYLIFFIPIVTSVLLNLCLFTRISVVLYRKLKSPINDNSRQYQKWMKSTMVLVPLFGVNYGVLLTLYYWTSTNEIVKMVWLTGDLLFGSFQGFCVAVLYCFLNGEVKSEVQSHLYIFLTYLATNKYSRTVFPWRKKFLRSVVGRSSVCTTMSCSSLYTNGVLHRNSKCRLDPKGKTGDKCYHHCCHNPSRRNSRQKSNFTGEKTVETSLCFESSGKKFEKEETEEEKFFMVRNDF